MTEKTGRHSDPIEYARDTIAGDPLASYLGITLDEVGAGYARCSIELKGHHLNALKRAHGSLVFALSDQALAVASNSTGLSAMTVSFTINFISGAVEGERIYAEARPVKTGKSMSVWRVEVKDTRGGLISSGEGISYNRSRKD